MPGDLHADLAALHPRVPAPYARRAYGDHLTEVLDMCARCDQWWPCPEGALLDRHRVNPPDADALAKALYEQQGARNVKDGTTSYIPGLWDDLPEGARVYWRKQADELRNRLPGLMPLVAEREALAKALCERRLLHATLPHGAIKPCFGCQEVARLLASGVLRSEAGVKAEALHEAADGIQALHPGEVKASVTRLRDLADQIGGDS